MNHTWEIHVDCRQSREWSTCAICDGGLNYCIVCRTGEGELPTECPGIPLTMEQRSSVFKGLTDYRKGHWRPTRVRM